MVNRTRKFFLQFQDPELLLFDPSVQTFVASSASMIGTPFLIENSSPQLLHNKTFMSSTNLTFCLHTGQARIPKMSIFFPLFTTLWIACFNIILNRCSRWSCLPSLWKPDAKSAG